MTRLKLLWRDSLSESDQNYWRAQFESPLPQSVLRQELQARYRIDLGHDNQLNRFRAWVRELDAQLEEARAMAADQKELELQGLSGEQLRDELLNRMKRRALNRGDFQLGLKAVSADIKSESLHLDLKKFKLRLRTKLGRRGAHLDTVLGGSGCAAATTAASEAQGGGIGLVPFI